MAVDGRAEVHVTFSARPDELLLLVAVPSAVVLAGITAVVVWLRRRH